MAKTEIDLVIRRLTNGNVIIFKGNSKKVVDVKKLPPKGKFLAVKEEVLKMGVVFGSKIEKSVRQEVGYYE